MIVSRMVSGVAGLNCRRLIGLIRNQVALSEVVREDKGDSSFFLVNRNWLCKIPEEC